MKSDAASGLCRVHRDLAINLPVLYHVLPATLSFLMLPLALIFSQRTSTALYALSDVFVELRG